MAKRLATKHKKRRADIATAYTELMKKGEQPARHKVAVERSSKAKLKNSARAY